MLFAVLGLFLISAVVLFTTSCQKKTAGWLYAAFPAGLMFFFASNLPSLLSGQTLHSSLAWFSSLGISLSFYLDMWALIFAVLITGIGALIVVYADGYLGAHPEKNRFFCYLFAFMASMLGTVLSSNAILLFIFWELTSLTSYFLIGFQHEEEKSRRNALQALLVTGLGGLAMLAGLVMIGVIVQSYEIQTWITQRDLIRSHALFAPALGLILLGAFTKSAQVPFHFWLPNAMVAPTPVSAYLHSSTMVKAGVYLLGRLSPLFGATVMWTQALSVVGALTMLTGAFLAIRAKDMKQHLAYLTVSALGLLVLLIGIGNAAALHAAALFLVAHAFYKGSLFMVAGSVHHACGVREPEKLSGLWAKMPVTALTSVAAGASLASLPPLFGFFAKESALEAAPAAVMVAISLAGMVYMAVFLWIALKPFLGKNSHLHAHEAPVSMWLGAAVLAFLGIVFPFAFPAASTLWSQIASAISPAPVHPGHHEIHILSPLLLWSAASWLGGLFLYAHIREIQTALGRFDTLWTSGPESVYHHCVKNTVLFAGSLTRILQNGSIRYYFRIIVSTAVFFSCWGFIRYGFPEVRTIPLYFLETGLVAMILIGTVATILTGEKLAAVAYLGIVGLSISLIFLLFGAPDLAMTQFAVEILTLILLALVLYRLPHFPKSHSKRSNAFDAVLSILAGFVMFIFVLAATYHKDGILPPVADFYVNQTLKSAHGHNIVNVILVDFRGFDTLGEITVLGIAGVGVFALLKLIIGKRKKAA